MVVARILRTETCPLAEILHGILSGMAISAKEGDLDKYCLSNRTFERWRTLYCDINRLDPHHINQFDRARDKICTYLTRVINDMPIRPNLLREAREIADLSLAYSS